MPCSARHCLLSEHANFAFLSQNLHGFAATKTRKTTALCWLFQKERKFCFNDSLIYTKPMFVTEFFSRRIGNIFNYKTRFGITGEEGQSVAIDFSSFTFKN